MPRKTTGPQILKIAVKIGGLLEKSGLSIDQQYGALQVAKVLLADAESRSAPTEAQ